MLLIVTERRPKPHVWPSRPDAYVFSRTAVEKSHENKDKFYRYDYRNQNGKVKFKELHVN